MALLLFLSCTPKKETPRDGGELRYARLLRLTDHGRGFEATILNPWDTTQVLRHIRFQGPARRLVVFSSVHCALLAELGALDHIAGVLDANYIRHPATLEAIRKGRIRTLGTAQEPNREAILDLRPDALLPSPYEGSQEGERLDVPIIDCADYMEVSPLARAEWIKLYGRLVGQRERADSIFQAVEREYLRLKKIAQKAKTRPTLLSEMPEGDTWYVAAGGSTAGQMYADAGASYLFADIPGTGSRLMSREEVYERAHSADYWFLKYDLPRPLRRSDLPPLLRTMKARIYGCNTRYSTYYEDTPFHPERLLGELIATLHPELGVTCRQRYHEEIKN